MRPAAFTLFVALAGLTAGCGKTTPATRDDLGALPLKVSGPAQPSDQDLAQGTWVVDQFDAPGIPAPPEVVRSVTATITGTHLTVAFGEGEERETRHYAIKFDPTKVPKVVDLTEADADGSTKPHKVRGSSKSDGTKEFEVPRKTIPAIYKFEGDRLVVAAPDFNSPRPREFKGSAPKAGERDADCPRNCPAPDSDLKGSASKADGRDAPLVVVVHLKKK